MAGPAAMSARTPHVAARIPHVPPARAKSALSASSCATRRPRVAPSAVRTASSRCRDAARASNMWATFAHAMSRTNETAARRTTSGVRMSPTTFSLRGSSTTSRLVPGNSRSSRDDTAPRSARACSSVTPGRSRANIRRLCDVRLLARAPNASGAHTSARVAQNGANWNVRGMTPTIVWTRPSSETRRPMIVESPPKRRCQRPYAITATASLPGASSFSVNQRPSSG